MVVTQSGAGQSHLVPILSYAASSHWKFPNAPHDLGTYPIACGTDDGGEGMPVEESGNMLILCDAVAQIDGNAKFVAPWWPQLTQWAKYLEQYGLDPEDQLCTDDFMGPPGPQLQPFHQGDPGFGLPMGFVPPAWRSAGEEKYHELAKADAKHWITVAADGDHFGRHLISLGLGARSIISVWDQILGLNVFPPQVAQKEVAHYKTVMQRYGGAAGFAHQWLTKTDWSFWSATLAQDQADFEKLISPYL